MNVQFTTNTQTDRVKELSLQSHTASDELFLSKLATAFMVGRVSLLYLDQNGEQRIATYTGNVEEF